MQASRSRRLDGGEPAHRRHLLGQRSSSDRPRGRERALLPIGPPTRDVIVFKYPRKPDATLKGVTACRGSGDCGRRRHSRHPLDEPYEHICSRRLRPPICRSQPRSNVRDGRARPGRSQYVVGSTATIHRTALWRLLPRGQIKGRPRIYGRTMLMRCTSPRDRGAEGELSVFALLHAHSLEGMLHRYIRLIKPPRGLSQCDLASGWNTCALTVRRLGRKRRRTA